MVQQYKQIQLFWMILGMLTILSCAGDPWPEPDTMENGGAASDGDTDADADDDLNDDVSGDSETDTAPSADADTDADVDADTDADADSDVDAGDIGDTEGDTDSVDAGETDVPIEDEDAHLRDRIYISAPNDEGLITIAGLPGAVPSGRTMSCFIEGVEYDVPVGLSRGFALRASAEPGDIVSLVVNDGADTLASVPVPVVRDAAPADWEDFVGDASGAEVLNDSFVSISLSGDRLEPNLLLVGVDLTRYEAAVSDIVCANTDCVSQMLIAGVESDDIVLFLAPGPAESGTAPISVEF